ncbi:hypothetical protein LSH36_1322g00034 [Paralvinella palmiformis]|uniref:EGF-like domain-containing protein n=1 Tax=Paralvinella palmiformis TaxID=53620 RepID=A0AAD9IT73_9ANNE|nr:hypothetical protein LSH36_1322g00034 [Paralvinella palmiformis]
MAERRCTDLSKRQQYVFWLKRVEIKRFSDGMNWSINECISDPCQHGGTCHDLINGYNCNCVSGFVGADCEIDFDECASNPCQNEGMCTDKVNGYSCSCVSGFVGVHCETGFGYLVIILWFVAIAGVTVYLYRRTSLMKRQQREATRKEKLKSDSLEAGSLPGGDDLLVFFGASGRLGSSADNVSGHTLVDSAGSVKDDRPAKFLV